MKAAKQQVGLKVQGGATLIVSLVILAVITILGIASMRSSNLELKMAASARDRSIAFQAAETALMQIEAQLSASPPPYGAANFTSSCTQDCFNSTCEGGLCFTGDFANAATYSDCQIAKTDKTIEHAWQNKAVWDTATKHMEIDVATSDPDQTENTVKYIVEFMCYTPVEQKIDGPNDATETGWVPMFRVTTNAQGESGRASVMLQSVIQAANN